MIDVARVKSRAPRVRRLPGSTDVIGIRPLTRAELEAADMAVTELFKANKLPTEGGVFSLAGYAEILARAMCETVEPYWPIADPADVLGAFSTDEILELMVEWLTIQADHHPGDDALEAEIELQIVERRGAVADMNAAAACENPADYYGIPATRLSDGQLAYFWTLRELHSKVTSESGATRCVSLTMLEKRAGRSRITNPSGDGLKS